MIVYSVFADELLGQYDALNNKIITELDTPDELEKYLNGEKDEFIYLENRELLNSIAFKIREQYAYASTLTEKSVSYYENLHFYADIYTKLVYNAVNLIVIRREDVGGSQPLLDLMNLIRTHMEDLMDVPALDALREMIRSRKAEYTDKPYFQAQFNNLLHTRQGIYTITAPQPLETYSNGFVLAEVQEITLQAAETSQLPPGTVLDQSSGKLQVDDPAQLKAGLYYLGIETTVEGGVPELETLIIQIGEDATAAYTLVESKPRHEYVNGDSLAIVATSDGEAITGAVILSGNLPPGTALNELTGEITVVDQENLVAGTYHPLIRTKDALSRLVDHLNPISILIDQRAVYTVNETKLLAEYITGDVVAEPIEDTWVFTEVSVSGLPEGVSLNPATGSVTVSDASLLKSGTYDVVIKTTDDEGFITQNILAFTIGEPSDTEANYTLNPVKNTLAEYQYLEVLAYPQDADGNIVAANFVRGTLPPGTAINTNNGEIVVLNQRNLIPGKYTFVVNTRDAKGGSSEIEINLPISKEVIYAISRPRNVDDFQATEIVAYPTDPGGAIQLASVTAGTLTAGLELQSDGKIRVTNPADLVPGIYTFSVTTTNEQDWQSVNEITLEFIEDQEAVYTLSDPKMIDTYVNDEVLASVSDPDGRIVKAEIIRGNLPGGTRLDAQNGTITVADASKLAAGIFTNIQVRTTDETGGKTDHTFTLEIIPDIPAVYTIFEALNVNQYVNGQNLAVVTDGNGPVVSARILEGSLPSGVAMDTSTGTIAVIDSSRLKSGTYLLKIETVDNQGGITLHTIELVIKAQDQSAVYIVTPPKNVDSYINGYVLASPVDPDGAIISALIITGAIPPGSTLNSSNGSIVVSDVNLLMAGSYAAEIKTTDVNNQTTTHTVQLTLLADNEAQYTLMQIKKYDLYNNGEYVATCTDADGDIVSAELLSGTLPAGLSLVTSSAVGLQIKTDLSLSSQPPVGYILVTDADQLAAAEQLVEIKTTDITGGKSVNTIMIELPADSEAEYTIPKARMKYAYRNGDVLASVVDPDGPIVSASLNLGSLPPGTTLDATTGYVTVSDRLALVAGTYTLGILTTDNTDGQTVSVISIVIKEMPIIKEFVGGTCERLTDVELKFIERLGSENVINRALLNFARVLEGKICNEFRETNGEQPWINGNRDQVIHDDKLAILQPLNSAILTKKAEINALPAGEAKNKAKEDMLYFTDLYNEVVMNMIYLTGMRNADLPPQANNPVKMLYAAVKTEMQSMSTITELDHLRQNISGTTFPGRAQSNAAIQSLIA